MSKKLLKGLMIVLVILVLMIPFSGCKKSNNLNRNKQTVGTYSLKITDSLGKTFTFDKEPIRIVSGGPNITETIASLGKMSKLVGRTDYCDYPAEVKGIDSIGNLTEPNIEKIVALKPDLVIVSTHFKMDAINKLNGLGIKTLALYNDESFDGVYSLIQKIGQVVNANSEAEKIIADMKQKVTSVEQKTKASQKPSVYYVVSFGKYGDFTAGGDTFIGRMIEMAGGRNIAADSKGWQYSLEKIVEKNPDVIICSKYFYTKNQLMVEPGYANLKAVKRGNIVEIDNNLLDRQGPRLADGLVELSKAIHPFSNKK